VRDENLDRKAARWVAPNGDIWDHGVVFLFKCVPGEFEFLFWSENRLGQPDETQFPDDLLGSFVDGRLVGIHAVGPVSKMPDFESTSIPRN
jgi:hypothetical protein